MNTYGYVGGNPVGLIDPYGLEPWDWDGQGNTATCAYYDQQAAQNPGCNYYKEAADICRGENDLVNAAIAAGLTTAWTTGLKDSQSTVLNNIRDILIWEDIARREEGNIDSNQCVCGNDVDRYHEFAFEFSGVSPFFYGGNRFPIQDFGPNPVPRDPRNMSDPRNWFEK